jgi:hypothetical protein
MKQIIASALEKVDIPNEYDLFHIKYKTNHIYEGASRNVVYIGIATNEKNPDVKSQIAFDITVSPSKKTPRVKIRVTENPFHITHNRPSIESERHTITATKNLQQKLEDLFNNYINNIMPILQSEIETTTYNKQAEDKLIAIARSLGINVDYIPLTKEYSIFKGTIKNNVGVRCNGDVIRIVEVDTGVNTVSKIFDINKDEADKLILAMAEILPNKQYDGGCR